MIKFLSSWTAVAMVIILFVVAIIWEGFSPKNGQDDFVFVKEKSELPALEASQIHEFGKNENGSGGGR